MLNQWIRVIKHVSEVYTDVSMELSQRESVAIPLATTDALFIGQHYPFNNLYVGVSAVNANTAHMHVAYWNNKEWESAVDVLDATKATGKTLAQSGAIQWSPDRDESKWADTADTRDNSAPPQLASFAIYDMYWLRLKPSANLSSLAAINRVGFAFCTSSQLLDIDPELNNYLGAWATGKINWTDQILVATEHLISDLKGRGLVVHAGQILRPDEFTLAVKYRTLSLIYGQLGPEFLPKTQAYFSEYQNQISQKAYTIDKNADGEATRSEIKGTQGGLVR